MEEWKETPILVDRLESGQVEEYNNRLPVVTASLTNENVQGSDETVTGVNVQFLVYKLGLRAQPRFLYLAPLETSWSQLNISL